MKNQEELKGRFQKAREELDDCEAAVAELSRRLDGIKDNEAAIKNELWKNVHGWVTEYITQITKDGRVSHHVTDAAEEIMMCSVLGQDVYDFINEIEG